MRNYFNLLLESERMATMFPKLQETRYGFLAGNVFNILLVVFMLYYFLGGSPDLYTLSMMFVYIISPLKYYKEELIISLPVTNKHLKRWDLQILALYMLLIMPFSFVLYFIPPFEKMNPVAWYVASSPTIVTIAVGLFTGAGLCFMLRIFSGFDPYRFIKSKFVNSLAYIITGIAGINAVHYLNIWLIGLW